MTNEVIANPAAAAQAVQTTFNAWHIVALGAGAILVHTYHVIVQAGGLKNIFSAFWRGPLRHASEQSPDREGADQGPHVHNEP